LRSGLANFLPRLALNQYRPDLWLSSKWNYRCEPSCLADTQFLW
jgi:hypothetical protein